MREVGLRFGSISTIVGNSEMGIISLLTYDGSRQISIPCDIHILYQFSLRFSQSNMVSRLIPEIMFQMVRNTDGFRSEIHFRGITKGVYDVVLIDYANSNLYPMFAPEAVLLSYISNGDIPMLMDADLFQLQSTPASAGNGISIPLNALAPDMLNKELEKAIKEENYELASHLRDEIKRRKK